MTKARVVLLEATEHRNRLLQQAGPLLGGALLTVGVATLIIAPGPNRLLGVLSAGLGIALFIIGGRVLVRWEVPYKGHRIRLHLSAVFGERLYIDEDRFDDDTGDGPTVLSGTITAGEGAGDRIMASAHPGIFGCRCRIEAESPTA